MVDVIPAGCIEWLRACCSPCTESPGLSCTWWSRGCPAAAGGASSPAKNTQYKYNEYQLPSTKYQIPNTRRSAKIFFCILHLVCLTLYLYAFFLQILLVTKSTCALLTPLSPATDLGFCFFSPGEWLPPAAAIEHSAVNTHSSTLLWCRACNYSNHSDH